MKLESGKDMAVWDDFGTSFWAEEKGSGKPRVMFHRFKESIYFGMDEQGRFIRGLLSADRKRLENVTVCTLELKEVTP